MKKIKHFFVFNLCLVLLQSISAQNLVPNSSFESHNGIPDNFYQFYYVNNWFGPYLDQYSNVWWDRKPTYYCFEDSTNALSFLFQFVGIATLPHTGRAFAGFYTRNINGLDRDYISVQLTQPLEIGTTYNVSFWLCNDSLDTGFTNHGLGTNNIGAYFSPIIPTYANPMSMIDAEPQVEIAEISYSPGWQQHQFSFTATEAARYLTIGNFRTDSETLYSNFSLPTDTFTIAELAYYYIDDVSVTPKLTAGSDTTICAGSLLNFTAKGGGTFVWYATNEPQTMLSQTAQLSVQPLVSTIYVVADGITTDSVTVYVEQLPTVLLSNDVAICKGDTLTITPQTTHATNYLWSTGSTDSIANITESGLYWLQISNTCGIATDSLLVSTPPPLPPLQLGNDTVMCSNAIIVLQSPLETGFYWQDNSSTPQYIINQTGTYSLTLQNNCELVTDTLYVETKPCGNDCYLLFPTAFSPNNDGVNDEFMLTTNCPFTQFNLQLYNRYGEKVFATQQANFLWNGTQKNKECEVGVYVWQLTYTDLDNKTTQQQKGLVTLVR